MKMTLAQAAVLSGIAFVLHLIWEYLQCSAFFIHGSLPPTHLAMLVASLGDVILTWILYATVALKRRHWAWLIRRWRKSDLALLMVLGFLLAAAIEWRALRTGRWSYTATTPLIPGLGISMLPVFQLLLLVPLTFWLTRLVFKGSGKSEGNCSKYRKKK